MPPLIETLNSLPLSDFLSLYVPPLGLLSPPPSSPPNTLRLYTSANIPAPLLSSCLALLTATSSADYASSSMGWSLSKKRREMKLPDLKYLVLSPSSPTNSSNPNDIGSESPISAFLSFMPTYEDGHEVLYVYELHVAGKLRGQGIGKRFMELVEEVGKRTGVEKVMLTVFTVNCGATRFYERLGYGVDDYSPEVRSLRDGRVVGRDYVILSKRVRA